MKLNMVVMLMLFLLVELFLFASQSTALDIQEQVNVQKTALTEPAEDDNEEITIVSKRGGGGHGGGGGGHGIGGGRGGGRGGRNGRHGRGKGGTLPIYGGGVGALPRCRRHRNHCRNGSARLTTGLRLLLPLLLLALAIGVPHFVAM